MAPSQPIQTMQPNDQGGNGEELEQEEEQAQMPSQGMQRPPIQMQRNNMQMNNFDSWIPHTPVELPGRNAK